MSKQSGIDHLIINSPFEEPTRYWSHDRQTQAFKKMDGRRPAGYIIASQHSKAFDDPGIFVEISLPNRIRPRVKAWRETDYPGVTGITRRLLKHWNNPEERDFKRFFFCQLEAIETLIWLVESAESEKVGIEIPSDGGAFERVCSKMATGTGKTVVMAMLIAWQVLNKVTYPQDNRFSKHIFIVAPGLTVNKRLQVLQTSGEGNYYDEFNVVPAGLHDKLRQGMVLIRNWHKLNWETEEQLAKKKSVDKRGAKSNEAYVREVLREMASASNIIVINDEAHHAWRIPAESKVRGVKKEDIEEATKWIGGLDRIHEARDILRCYDFSATPFAPSGKQSTEEALFNWIVSDFGLNDAIESGLVKTPRVVVRDDSLAGAGYKSRLYHIYNDPEVRDDINHKGAEEHQPLPDLINKAYYLLGKDWRETANMWSTAGFKVPPVMITVANRTETAARICYAFKHKDILVDELCDPERLLHIDSKVLGLAEQQEEPLTETPADTDAENGEETGPLRKQTKKEAAEELRQKVDTVGKEGKPGEQYQNIISVGMLSEGWDAKTVTHIMGLRAFSSQLLCEQVVGRGLRRTSYEIKGKLFEPEYVNIFGVPFSFLPHEAPIDVVPEPPTPKILIEPDAKKKRFEIIWPNIIRIDHDYRPQLTLDLKAMDVLEIDAYDSPQLVDLAPVIDGKPDISKIAEIDLLELDKKSRMQTIVFHTARKIYDQTKPNWKGSKEFLLAQVIRLVENFLACDRIRIWPKSYGNNDLRRRILLTLDMTKVVNHVMGAIRYENTEAIVPVFDSDKPIRSTSDMRQWYTGKPCEYTKRSHINFCVYDSKWEAAEAFGLERHPNVDAWVKNDHLGFEISYVFGGVIQKYRPDFLIRLKSGTHIIVEVKGQDTQKDHVKREFLSEWVKAINGHGGFGQWQWAVSNKPGGIMDILDEI